MSIALAGAAGKRLTRIKALVGARASDPAVELAVIGERLVKIAARKPRSRG
jgi:hypothetical protein